MCMYCWLCVIIGVNSVYVLMFLIASAKFQPTDTKILSWLHLYMLFSLLRLLLFKTKNFLLSYSLLLYFFKVFLLIISIVYIVIDFLHPDFSYFRSQHPQFIQEIYICFYFVFIHLFIQKDFFPFFLSSTLHLVFEVL